MIIGIICYVLPIYFNSNVKQLAKLHKLQIFACKTVMGGNYFRMSNVKLLMKCKWMSIANVMRHSVLVFIHKIKINSRLQSLNELFTKSKSIRNITKTYPIYEPKTKKLKNFLIYKGNKLYNKILSYLIKTKLNIFKKSLTKIHSNEL